jgi:hypothetical protein
VVVLLLWLFVVIVVLLLLAVLLWSYLLFGGLGGLYSLERGCLFHPRLNMTMTCWSTLCHHCLTQPTNI